MKSTLICGYAISSAHDCIKALENAGVKFQSVSMDKYPVLLYDEPDKNLLRLVYESRQGGENRILAVGLSPSFPTEKVCSLLKIGAEDVFLWNDKEEERFIQGIKARLERWAKVDELMDKYLISQQIVGKSSCWLKKLQELVEAAYFTPFPILLTGESGTGKELAARLIHELDPRPEKGQFVVIDCTTMTPDLAGSELFGHEQGAFTGATYRREGALALADKGTLFLDEIGELPVVLQAKILRAVQEHIYKRVGSNTWQQSDFRLICATNRNLEEEMQQGQFRSDLFFRISGLICTLPPLRERTEDILPLVQHFFRELRSEEAPELDTRVQEYFLCYHYPGNVRELKHRVMRVIQRYTGFGPLSIGCIPPWEREDQEDRLTKDFEQLISRLLASGRGLKEIGQLAEETAVRLAITDANGKLKVAAQRLGVTDRALQMRQAKTKHLMTQSGEVSYLLK